MIKRVNFSRRKSLKTLGMLGAAGAITSARPDKAFAGLPTEHAACLAIVGDRYHNPDYIKTALNKTLVKDLGLSIDYLWEDDYLTEDLLKKYKLLLIFRDGVVWPAGYFQKDYPRDDFPRPIGDHDTSEVTDPPLDPMIGYKVPWMTRAQGKFIKSWVKDGGSLWAFHNVSQCSNMNEDFKEVEGAIYAGHPRVRPFWVRVTNSNHPIMKGVNDFLVTDEQHYVEYYKNKKYILAESSYEGDEGVWTDNLGRENAKAPACWAYDYGKGRVCFMAPGHYITVMWNKEYEKMQKNGLLWLLEKK
jgi:hypothetical protein